MENKNISIIVSDTAGKTEDFKRSDHPDFLYSSELKTKKWSGIRHNSIMDIQEIWVLGEIKGSMAMEMVAKNPEKWENLWRDVFGLNDVTTNSR